MSRVPIRVRLTLAFALSAAIVLAAVSVFLLVRLRSSLDEAIDEGLATRSRDVAALVERGAPLVRPGEPDEGVAQVVRRGGAVESTTSVPETLLTPEEVSQALTRRVVVDRRRVPGFDGDLRLVAVPVTRRADTVVLTVGAPLEDRDDAVSTLVRQLLLVSPLALLLVSLGGYLVATAALRPVERMRREAAAVSGVELGRRLTAPPARDEISRLAATLNEMLGRLDGAIERERRFVADASHELRAPLTVLRAELELALRRPRERDELQAALASAAGEADRLSRVADDLLVLARVGEGQLPLRRTVLDVRELLDRVVARCPAPVAVTCPPGLEVEADELRLEQAIGNLLDNAVRHGGATIAVTAVSADGRVELHVTDDGHGFPPAFLPRAFDRFSRADDARGRGGTGLGLAIADAIARAHGGSAHVSNRPGGGADVWLELPA